MSEDGGADYDGYKIYLAERELNELDEGRTSARGPIDDIWRAVASGSLPMPDIAEWARIIAQRVIRDVIDDSSFPDERGGRALKALGIHGVSDANYKERKFLETWLSFEELAIPSPLRIARAAKLLSAMRSAGFYKGVSDRDAKKRIGRLESTIRKTAR